LPAGDGRIEWMHHLHHCHIEADICHALGQMVGNLMLLESGAWDAKQRLLDFENARGIDVPLHGGQFGGHVPSPGPIAAGVRAASAVLLHPQA
jgi:hypothetical protein